jgi:hypothetical protein
MYRHLTDATKLHRLGALRAAVEPILANNLLPHLTAHDVGELSASEDEVDGARLIPSACMPRHGGQADAHSIFKGPESSLA